VEAIGIVELLLNKFAGIKKSITWCQILLGPFGTQYRRNGLH
jgi:hypothetical protein